MILMIQRSRVIFAFLWRHIFKKFQNHSSDCIIESSSEWRDALLSWEGHSQFFFFKRSKQRGQRASSTARVLNSSTRTFSLSLSAPPPPFLFIIDEKIRRCVDPFVCTLCKAHFCQVQQRITMTSGMVPRERGQVRKWEQNCLAEKRKSRRVPVTCSPLGPQHRQWVPQDAPRQSSSRSNDQMRNLSSRLEAGKSAMLPRAAAAANCN